jgi:ADP-ribose pyrophosphatase YjhB (NUDIX family)
MRVLGGTRVVVPCPECREVEFQSYPAAYAPPGYCGRGSLPALLPRRLLHLVYRLPVQVSLPIQVGPLTGTGGTASNHRMPMSDPDWLTWARELQAVAQTGMTFTRDPYDRERYQAIRALAARMFAAHTDTPVDRIIGLFSGETGYATPKIDVRAAVFDSREHLLMVRESADGGRWTLPGGWADVNRTAAENAVKEVLEESGYEVRVRKLAAVWDRTRQGHPNAVFSCCKLFFICEPIGGRPTTGLETSEVAWFAEDDIPQNLSLGRALPRQIRRMFAHRRDPSLPTDFE